MSNDKHITFINRLTNVLLGIITVFLLVVLAYCSITAFSSTASMEYNMDEATFFLRDSILRNVIYSILFLVILWALTKCLKKVPSKYLFGFCAVIMALFLLYLITSINPTPTWDAYRTYSAAEQFLQGDYTMFQTNGYIADYPFQIPIVIYNIILITLFKDNYIVPQLLNIVYVLGTYWCLYRISGMLSKESETVKKICTILLFSFFPCVMYVMFIYSNIPSLFFMTIGLFFGIHWLQSEKLSWLISAFLTIGISSWFKGTAYIAIIALVILVILKLLQHFSWKVIISFGIIIAFVTTVPTLMNNIVARQDSSINLSSDLYLEYAIEMGSKRSLRGAGWHDGWLETYLNDEFTLDSEKKDEAWRIIKENYANLTKNPSTFISFYQDKLNSMWINPEWEGFWTIQANKQETLGKGDPMRQSLLWIQYNADTDGYDSFTQSYMTGYLNKGIRAYLNTQMNIIYISCLFGLLVAWRRKQLHISDYLLPLTFLGGFLFLIIWEAKTQYSLLFYVLLFPLAAQMLAKGYEYLEALIKQKKA